MVSLGDIWEFVKGSPARVPMVARIAAQQALDPLGGPEVVTPHEHYFVVQVERMFLEKGRKWLREVDPVVLAICEYRYGRGEISLPFVIGRALLGNHATQTPHGMLYKSTRVAGIHPYRGGKLVMSLILCQSTTTDYARRLVALVEGLAGAVPFGEELGTYTRLAGSLMEGIDALLGVGETQPLVGFREEFDHDLKGREVKPMFGVLVDDDAADELVKRLWVKDGELMIGDSRDSLQPFRSASYVLYSIQGVPRLSTVKSLPISAGDEEIRRLMRSDKPENLELGKARLLDLWDRLLGCPDITEADAKRHIDGLLKDIEGDRARFKALKLSDKRKAEARDEVDDADRLAGRREAIARLSKL